MPPKRSREQLRAIADGPIDGLLLTPLAKNGVLSGPYLAVMLYCHQVPVTYEQMMRLSGHRLWQGLVSYLSADCRHTNDVRIEDVPVMVRASNNGFRAPIEMQDRIRSLVAILPGGAPVSAQLLEHYTYCRAFRTPESELSSPPSHLDFYKDERVEKRWRIMNGRSMVDLNLNSLLRTWPQLMSDTWGRGNASRDAAAVIENIMPHVQELHKSIDEGANVYTMALLIYFDEKCHGIERYRMV